MPPAVPAGVPFGVYVHVPFCAVRCGYCDFNTYTATELGGGGSQAAYAGHAVAEVDVRRPRARPRACRGSQTVFFGGGTPTLLPSDDLTPDPGAPSTGSFGLAAGRRGDHRGQPATASRRRASRPCATAGSPGSRSGCSRPCPHVLRVLERTHDPARVAQAVQLGARGGLRAGEPRPDLRDAGGERRGLAGLDRRGPGLRAGPRLGVLPDRGGRHPARPPGAHRRDPGAGRRRPRRQVRARRRRVRRGRAGVVRGLQLGPRRGRALPAQRALLDQRELVGRRSRARTRTSRASGGGTSSTPARTPPGSPPGSRRPRTARCSTSRPARWSGCCSRSGCATGCPLDLRRRRPASTASSTAASPSRDGDRLVLTRRGRLLADAVVRELVG